MNTQYSYVVNSPTKPEASLLMPLMPEHKVVTFNKARRSKQKRTKRELAVWVQKTRIDKMVALTTGYVNK